jgi:hypothetical protein
MTMKRVFRLSIALAALSGAAVCDEVTEWNRIMLDAMLVPPAFGGPLAPRPAAIVQAAVFDAVNGIERRFTPIHVAPAAAPGASQRAAAVQAAYASLVHLFPAQAGSLAQKRTESLARIGSGQSAENSESIERGIAWGQTVADAIWAWRSTDGFSTVLAPYTGGLAPGQWRPTPPAFAPGLAPQLAHVTPWVIGSPSQFRPTGPPALTSSQYAADLNETEAMGSATGSGRTADETLYSLFWQSGTPPDFWDPVATGLSTRYNLNLSENARLLAMVNVAMADAIIGCWDAKYAYSFWRPITAIQLADTDGNSATTANPTWTPLIGTPPFPEYPSAHSCVSGAAGRVLSAYFGENTAISVTSDGMPGVVRSFGSIPDALEEVKNARVFGGIHFRAACNDGQGIGIGVADYLLQNAMLPVHGQKTGQLGK